MFPSVRILSSCGVATLHNTRLWIVHGKPNSAELEQVANETLELAKRHPTGIYTYTLITEDARMPGATERALLQRQFEQLRGKLIAAAVALESSSISGRLGRTLLSTLITATKRPFQLRMFADRASAAAWLSGHPGTPSSADMQALVGTMERKLRLAKTNAA
jgi:hypothetical protein